MKYSSTEEMTRRKIVLGAGMLATTGIVGGCATIGKINKALLDIDQRFLLLGDMWEEGKEMYLELRQLVIQNKHKLGFHNSMWAKLVKLDNMLIEANLIVEKIKEGHAIAHSEAERVKESVELMHGVTRSVVKIIPALL